MQDLPSVLFKLQGKTSTASLSSNQETFGPLDWSDVDQARPGVGRIRQPSLSQTRRSFRSSVVGLCDFNSQTFRDEINSAKVFILFIMKFKILLKKHRHAMNSDFMYIYKWKQMVVKKKVNSFDQIYFQSSIFLGQTVTKCCPFLDLIWFDFKQIKTLLRPSLDMV